MSQHPGRYLAEIIQPERKKDFAARLGVSTFTLWKILHERQRIEPRMAAKLAKATGTDARYWLDRQAAFDAHQLTQPSQRARGQLGESRS
jgi:addiction module HigA family antidote